MQRCPCMFQRGERTEVRLTALEFSLCSWRSLLCPLYRGSTAFQITEYTLHRHFSLDAHRPAVFQGWFKTTAYVTARLVICSQPCPLVTDLILKLLPKTQSQTVVFAPWNFSPISLIWDASCKHTVKVKQNCREGLTSKPVSYLNPLRYAVLLKLSVVLFGVATAGNVGLLVCRARRPST